jgi:two-component system response regulator (stage 0 sporulation protein F)
MASILIIDDEEDVRGLLRAVLEQNGYQVSEAVNGKEGVAQYRTTPADVVVVDIMMPVQDGLETIMALTREFINAKVIAMTGASGDRNKLDVAKLLGARYTLQKPFSMQTLLSAIQYELAH